MKKKFSIKSESMQKKLARILDRLEGKAIVVEGKKDSEAFALLGYKTYRVSGRTKRIAEIIRESEAVILTDLDERGSELAKEVKEELEAHSIKCDVETRKELAKLLQLRYFEDIEKRYREFIKTYGW